MIAALTILGLVILLIPAIALIGGGPSLGLLASLAALALAILAWRLSPSDIRRFSRLLSLLGYGALALPLIWMLIQILPVTSRSLINPIWVSSAAATGQPVVGSISLDIGATLLSLAHYSLVAGITVLATAVALNRSFAKAILSLLTIAATAVAVEMTIKGSGVFQHSAIDSVGERADTATIAMIGLVLSSATTIQAYERFSSRKRPTAQMLRAEAEGLASIIAFCLCLVAILMCADIAILLAALLGVGTLAAVFAIRNWRLGSWGQAGIAAVSAVVLVGLVTTMPGKPDSDLTRRMLSDGRWVGTGAGSFEALLPIYADETQPSAVESPPAAAKIVVEMGRPFLWFTVISALSVAIILIRRSLRRGRDYVYSSAAAGCAIATLVSLFSSAGILTLTASLVAGATLGLGIGQSTSEKDSGSTDADSSDRPNSGMMRTFWARKTFALLAVALAGQAVWLLLPELSRSQPMLMPLDQKQATVARADQERINHSASLALARGDLWAQSAFTYAGQMWADRAIDLDPGDHLSVEALNSLSQSLRYAPHRGDIWLMFAAMATRCGWRGYRTDALLKMSYYTAPNQIRLIPLRLSVSLHEARPNDDSELRDMIRNDIDYLLTRSPSLKPALIAAYNAASRDGKALVEQIVAQVEPTYLDIVRGRYP